VKTRFSTLTACHVAAILAGAAPGAAASPSDPVALSPRAQALVCAPRTLESRSPAPRVLAGRDRATKGMFGPGDTIVLDASTGTPMASGQVLVVYRRPRSAVSEGRDALVRRAAQNAGLVQVDAVSGKTATATVVWACDGIQVGDRLEPYRAPESAPEAAAAGGPARFDQATRVAFGGQDRRLGAARDLMLVVRASGLDVAVGQRVVFFRRPFGADGPTSIVGDGVVQVVSDETYLVEITSSKDAISAGDLVAARGPA
jgi:hypothetical protein